MANPFGKGSERLVVNQKHPLAHKLAFALVPRGAGRIVDVVSGSEFDPSMECVIDANGFWGPTSVSTAGPVYRSGPGLQYSLGPDTPFTVVSSWKCTGGNFGGTFPGAYLTRTTATYYTFGFKGDGWTRNYWNQITADNTLADNSGTLPAAPTDYITVASRTDGATAHDTATIVGTIPGAGTLTVTAGSAVEFNALSFTQVNFNPTGNWHIQFFLGFQAKLTDDELKTLASFPQALIQIERAKPTTTGELDGVSLRFMGAWGTGFGTGTASLSRTLTNLPKGSGLLVQACIAYATNVLSVLGMELSKDGGPLELSPKLGDDFEWNQWGFFPLITDPEQTLTVHFNGGYQEGQVYLWEVTGHDPTRMLEYAVYNPASGTFPTDMQDGAAILLNGQVQAVRSTPAIDWKLESTNSFYTRYTSWVNSLRKGSSIIVDTGASRIIAIRRGEKVRRKRFVTVREPWTTQPRGLSEVDLLHPLAKNLLGVYLPTVAWPGYNPFKRQPGTFQYSDALGLSADEYGTWARCDSLGAVNIQFDGNNLVGTATPFSWSVNFSYRGAPSANIDVLGMRNSSGGEVGGIYVGADGSLSGHVNKYSAGTNTVSTSAAGILMVGNHVATLTRTTGLQQLYLDGALVAESVPDDTQHNGAHYRLGPKRYGVGLLHNGAYVRTYGCMEHLGVLQPAEIAALSDNFWQLFKPRLRRVEMGPLLTHKRRRVL